MKEHEAFAAAKERANQTGVTWFVVTSRECEGYDYDIAASGSLNRQTVVCGSVEPERSLAALARREQDHADAKARELGFKHHNRDDS